MAVQAGIKIGVDGEREYRQAIANINQATKELDSEMKLLTSEFDKNASSQAKAAASAEVMRRQIDNQEKKVAVLSDKYKKQTDELNRLGAELDRAKKEYGENSAEAQRAQLAYDQYSTAVSKTKTELNKAETELNKMNATLAETEKRAGGADGSLATVPSTLDNIRAGAENVSAAMSKVSEGLETAAQKTAAISAAAAAVLGVSAVSAAKYEDAIAKVATIADESTMSIDDMSAAIMGLSDDTGIAASELADAVYNAISAGQDTADAVSFVERATRLARAGFTETGDALDVLTTIMNAYGLEASEVENVSDTLIQTQNLGKTTVAELASAMGKVIPTAASFGVSLDQLGAAYAVITANGVRTREATTYMNALFNELGKSSTGLAKTLADRTGKSFAELTEEGKSVADILAILKEAADDQGVAFNDLFSSSEAAKAGLILLGDSADTFNDTLGKMRSATGSTDKAFGKLETTSYGITKTLNLLKNTGIEMGETLLEIAAPSLEALSDIVRNVRDSVAGMDDKTKKLIVSVGLAAAALSPALGLLSKLSGAVSAVSSAVSTLIANPVVAGIGLAVAAIGGLTAALVIAEKQAQAEREAFAAAALALTDEQIALFDSASAVVSVMADARAATDDAASSMAFQRDRAIDLVAELASLIDSEGYVAETDRDHAQVIMDELARAFGIEIEMIDGQIQGYETLEESIYDIIDAKTAEALLDRRRDDYLTALENEAQLNDALAEAQAAVTQGIEDRQNAVDELARLQREYQENLLTDTAAEAAAREEDIADLEAYIAAWEEEQAKRVQTYADLERAAAESNHTIQNYEAAQLAAMNGDTNRVIELMTGRANAWRWYGDNVDAETSRALDAMYEEVVRAAEYSAEVRENWEAGVEGYTEEMVTEAENAFVNMRNAFSTAYDDATSIGYDFMSGLDYGLNSQKNQLIGTVNAIAGVIPHGMRDVLNMHSPSRVAIEIGQLFDAGLVRGLTRGAEQVEAAAASQADAMVAAFGGVSDVFGSANLASVVNNGGRSSVNYGGVSITVNASDEMSAREIAEEVMEQMQAAVERRGAVFA